METTTTEPTGVATPEITAKAKEYWPALTVGDIVRTNLDGYTITSSTRIGIVSMANNDGCSYSMNITDRDGDGSVWNFRKSPNDTQLAGLILDLVCPAALQTNPEALRMAMAPYERTTKLLSFIKSL